MSEIPEIQRCTRRGAKKTTFANEWIVTKGARMRIAEHQSSTIPIEVTGSDAPEEIAARVATIMPAAHVELVGHEELPAIFEGPRMTAFIDVTIDGPPLLAEQAIANAFTRSQEYSENS